MDKYKEILSKYPVFVGLEQLRIICKISKRKAKYILANGYIPSINSGKKTRQYRISTQDIIRFLVDFENSPEKYPFPSFSSKQAQVSHISIVVPTDKRFIELLEQYYIKRLIEYPDLLTPAHISELIGYSKETTRKWIHEEKFLALRRGTLIPKKTFFPFLTGRELTHRRVKSNKHQMQINEILEIYNS